MSERLQGAVNELIGSGFEYERATDSWRKIVEECRVVIPIFGVGDYQRMMVAHLGRNGSLNIRLKDGLTEPNGYLAVYKREIFRYPLQSWTKVETYLSTNREKPFDQCIFWYIPEAKCDDGTWGTTLKFSLGGIYNATYNLRGELMELIVSSNAPNEHHIMYKFATGEVYKIVQGEEEFIVDLLEFFNRRSMVIGSQLYEISEIGDTIQTLVTPLTDEKIARTVTIPEKINLEKITRLLTANSKDWLWLPAYVPIKITR